MHVYEALEALAALAGIHRSHIKSARGAAYERMIKPFNCLNISLAEPAELSGGLYVQQ